MLIAAIIKGYSKGLVLAAFSFFAIIIGLAAALKLSATVSLWLQKSTNIAHYWLPFLSFLIIMVAVYFIVQALAKTVEKILQFALMGWLNKLGGILFFSLLYISIYSTVLFFILQMGILNLYTINNSKTFPFLSQFAPKVIEILSVLLPFLKSVFLDLSNFFATK